MSYILIGPDLEPYTGQSIAFHNVANNFEGESVILTYGGTGITKIYRTVVLIIRFLVLSFLNRSSISAVYITTSRSIMGSIRDIVILCISGYFGLRLVNHLHGADFVEFRNKQGSIFRRVLDYSYSKIDSSIVLLPSMAEQYSAYSSMRVDVVSNGVKSLYSSFYKKRENNISYLSNIMYSKGVIHLIDAIVELNENRGMHFELNIAGCFMSDSEMSASEVKKLFFSKISSCDYINYLGVVSGDEKSKLLNESDFFVLPTFYKTEAQPLSIMEAMSCGNVIITTNHNYISDIIGNAHGRLIKPQSVGEIAKALEEISGKESVKKNIMKNNQVIASEQYSLDSYVNGVSRIILGSDLECFGSQSE